MKQKPTQTSSNLTLALLIVTLIVILSLLAYKYQKRSAVSPESRLTQPETIDNRDDLNRDRQDMDSVNLDATFDPGLIQFNSESSSF